MPNPYRAFVDTFAVALRDGAALTPREPEPPAPATGPLALLFAPHPDDEVIVGALPLRLRREAGWRIAAVAVTLGSRADRRAARWQEMSAACAALGFDLLPTGLQSPVDPAAPATVASLLATHRPSLIVLPHAADWHPTHIATHSLVTDALRTLPDLDTLLLETEFWGAMADPNLMVGSSPADVADLVAALALHTGEVARNPYHLRLPAWMIDNVRRGAELVGGKGAPAPDWPFATLYRLRGWRAGTPHDVVPLGQRLAAADSAAAFIEASLSTVHPAR